MIPLETDNLTANEYNKLFKQEDFWNKVDAENILVFQTDSVLCQASLQDIDNFINYDYIGCSVDDKTIGDRCPGWPEDSHFYGIGGLSFRKKSFMTKCIENTPKIDPYYPEDVFYSNCVSQSSRKPENADILAKFCAQHSYNNYNSFGVHKPTDLKKEDRESLFKYCPEAKLL
jgi:hypothetical protein